MIATERLVRAAKRHGDRFYRRFFTPRERDYCQDDPHRLAARFAAKEAVGKAFGTGIGDIRWVEIEILHDARGRPELHLHGDAAKLAESMGLTLWDVSLSHTNDHAIAVVVAMGN